MKWSNDEVGLLLPVKRDSLWKLVKVNEIKYGPYFGNVHHVVSLLAMHDNMCYSVIPSLTCTIAFAIVCRVLESFPQHCHINTESFKSPEELFFYIFSMFSTYNLCRVNGASVSWLTRVKQQISPISLVSQDQTDLKCLLQCLQRLNLPDEWTKAALQWHAKPPPSGRWRNLNRLIQHRNNKPFLTDQTLNKWSKNC